MVNQDRCFIFDLRRVQWFIMIETVLIKMNIYNFYKKNIYYLRILLILSRFYFSQTHSDITFWQSFYCNK